MIKNQNIENLFLRLMEGEELSNDEKSLLKEWVAENPDEAKEYYKYSLIWNEFDTFQELDDDKINDRWLTLNNKYFKRKNKTLGQVRELWKYAAVFIAGLLISFLIYTFGFNDNVAKQTVEVPFGAKSTIKLSDGTEVILNAGSKLDYDTKFNMKDRVIHLSGEAYFKVAKNKLKPFTVITHDMIVKAYGTVFNVKAYPGDDVSEAILIEGSISVKIKSDKKLSEEIYLKPDEQLVYKRVKTGNGKLMLVKNIDAELYTSWVNNNILVKSKTLKELAVMLERKYNVNIYIMDKDIENKRFTGLLKNETIEQILQALKLSAHIDYKINNREIWLYNNHN